MSSFFGSQEPSGDSLESRLLPQSFIDYRDEVGERDEKRGQFLEKAGGVGGEGDGGEGADQRDLLCQVRMLVHHHVVTRHPLAVTQYLQSYKGYQVRNTW